jgi:sugar/nucleoside kinase (ribokinase family)
VSARPTPDLVVLGDCNPDLVLSDPEIEPAFGQEERLIEHAELTIGGSGAIMACAAARLGLRTALIGLVGEDHFGRFMLDALAQRGVDVSGVVADDRLRTGLTVILARPDDRAILTFPGAIPSMAAERIDSELLHSARHVHVSSYFLQTGLVAGLEPVLRSVRAGGVSTSLDPNWDPSGRWDAGLRALLPQLDLLLPNAAEACRISGTEDPSAAALKLAEQGPLVAVKLGADGAIAADAHGRISEAPAPRGIEPVDTVGAGDAFDAGFIKAYLAGEGTDRALAFACACGALSTLAAGGVDGQPTLADARALAAAAE